jgi:hypothetical protein
MRRFLLGFGRKMLVLDVRPKRFKQVRDAFAMLGAHRDRIAEPKPVCIEDPRLTCPSLGLVTDDDHWGGFDAQPAPDLLVEWSHPFARVDQEQGGVGVTHCRFGLRTHPPRQGVRVLVLEPRRIDHPKVEPEQLRLALAAVARHARPVVDQREALADEPVEQRRFADVGPADNGDGGQGHRAGD